MTDESRKPHQRRPFGIPGHVPPEQPVIFSGIRTGGVPEIRNGLAMCKIHHTAFDRDLIGIRPDTIIEIRADILAEEDGPMLKHGLQGMHGLRLHVPGRREHKPDRAALEYRYEQFRSAAGI